MTSRKEGLQEAVRLIQAQQDAFVKNQITATDFDRGADAAFGMAVYVVLTAISSLNRRSEGAGE
jgi:hypothetical protein